MKVKFLFAALFIILNTHAQILSYTNFRTPAQVDNALNTLHTAYPALTSIQTLGTSILGAPIRALRISNSPANNPAKGDVVFIGLAHSREWITIETILYIADRMLAEYNTVSQVKQDLDQLQIWIIPISNPDGFNFTHTGTSCASGSDPRMWRKNRRDNGDGSFGVDLNRNWGYQWGLTPGSSGFTGDDTYRGTAPFSEKENQVIRDFLASLTNFKAVMNYHSYSELHLRPWAYVFKYIQSAPGEQTLNSISERNINLIQSVHGHSYVDTIWYTSSGNFIDYIWNQYHAAGFTTELRPASAFPGFCAFTSDIIPCAEENYPAAIAIVHDAALPHIWIKDNPGDMGEEPSSGYTWESPDIWTVPAILNQGATVVLHVRVNNNTGTTVNNVTVEAYYTDPRITLEFPSLSSNLIGNTIVNVPTGGMDVTFTWVTPVGTNIWGERHWCVGAVIKQATDMPLTTVVRRSSNVACHNFNTTTVVEGSDLFVAATNFLQTAAELEISYNKNELPDDWQLQLPGIEEMQRYMKLSVGTIRKSSLLKTTNVILEPGQTIKIPIKIHFEKIPEKDILIRIRGQLIPLVAGKRMPVENGYTFQVTAKK